MNELILHYLHHPDIRLSQQEEAKVVKGPNGEKLFSGLRVKCAIHHGEPLHHEDPASGKVFYVGPVMNMLSGILDIAAGGQVVITSDAWSVVKVCCMSYRGSVDCANSRR